MKQDSTYKCDQCGFESTKGMRIGLTTDPVTKHFCKPTCFVNYCDKHKRLQNTIAYAMYKDLVESETQSSTESTISGQGEKHDT
jgi:uncharacterized ferredoxin-like protein